MAWNDVYYNDNAVHLLIKVGGYSFNFTKGIDIKVERKLGDTLSKFSLGIIDDGSEDFMKFERIILNRFTAIDVEYGNSSKTMQKFQGFVVDYQPVFLGPSSKLTVTGYLTRQTVGTPSKISSYVYYIDWQPLIGIRRDNKKTWDDIYNRSYFSMKTDSYGNKVKDEQIMSDEEAEVIINDALAELKTSYDDAKNLGSTLLGVLTKLSDNYNMLEVNGTYQDMYGKPVNYRSNKDITKVELIEGSDAAKLTYKDGSVISVGLGKQVRAFEIMMQDPYNNAATIQYPNGITENITYDKLQSMLVDGLPPLAYAIGNDLHQSVLNAQYSIMRYEQIYEAMKNLVNTDTIGNAAGRSYELGHVPWQPDIIKYYNGNVRFQTYTHPDDSTRAIARVIPDLFIQWDGDLPCAPEYLDEDNQPRSGKIEIFPDDAINDIKMFGLMYDFNQEVYENNPGNPYAAFNLRDQDIHGVYRVYTTADGTNYIWVGDVPELYEKWKNNKWQYSEYTSDTTLGKETYVSYAIGQTYKKGTHIINDMATSDGTGTPNMKYGVVLKDFTSAAKADFWASRASELNKGWKKDVEAGNIQEQSASTDNDTKKGSYFRTYKIKELESNEDAGVHYMSVEERVTKYLQAAYRSGQPLSYGKVYISDIVAQLCELEGWKNPKIVATTASSYKSSFLNMNGMTALEYISQQLCPNAIEDGGTGKSGFQCFFDNKGRFHFEPVIMDKTPTVLTLGYNVNNSPVLSFTVRSRGQILMLGIDAAVDEINIVTGETISVSSDKSSMTSSNVEAKLSEEYDKLSTAPTFSAIKDSSVKQAMADAYQNWLSYEDDAQFFNLALFNYYGYEQNVDNYLTFIMSTKLNTDLPWGTSLLRRTYNSGSVSSTEATLKALADLTHLYNTSIEAELTMIGDNKIAPGQYIKIINYTRKGKHYTSGDYYIRSITDSVTKGNGFTQSLSLYRFSKTVKAMNTGLTSSDFNYLESTNKLDSLLQEGIMIFKDQGYDAYAAWYQEKFPDSELKFTVDYNDGFNVKFDSTTEDGYKYTSSVVNNK